LKDTSETEATLEPSLWDDGAALTPKHLAGVEGAVEEDRPAAAGGRTDTPCWEVASVGRAGGL
jgi:hypothetical protein